MVMRMVKAQMGVGIVRRVSIEGVEREERGIESVEE